jgi:hypothetical protein
MAAEAELIHNVSQVTFLHADHFIARLEKGQETTLIENRKIIDYPQFKPNDVIVNRQIAEQLCLSTKTVETYRSRIKEKLSLTSASELLQYDFQRANRQV